jgi:hypothetical protein
MAPSSPSSCSSPPLSPSKVRETQLIFAKAKAAAKKSKGNKELQWQQMCRGGMGKILRTSRYLIVRSLQTPPDATVWIVAGSSSEQNRIGTGTSFLEQNSSCNGHQNGRLSYYELPYYSC